MDSAELDLNCYLNDIEQYRTTLVPKWHEFVFQVPEKERWKLALLLENTEIARKKAIENISSVRNNVFLNKAALYDVADWFLNFPFRDIISIQPISQPCALAYHRTNGELMQAAVTAHSKRDCLVRTAFIDDVVTAIMQIADYPVAAIPQSKIEEYEKVIIGPPDTRVIAVLRGNNTNVIPDSFDVRFENGYRTEKDGIITVYIDGLPRNEVIYCFGSQSDFGSPISICPYVMSLLASVPISRAVVHAFQGASKFFNRIRII